ncbi:MAG: hypothetical protein J6V66_02635 [Clostridia bacterium]|nr:hypothetical protein [Clostridia bacterium]
MIELITVLVIGVALIVIGILNFKGNIKTMHAYHRKRVKEEDILPYGRLVGIGTMIAGVSIMIVGSGGYVSDVTGNKVYGLVSAIVGVALIALALVLIIYAMIKYNKGIF